MDAGERWRDLQCLLNRPGNLTGPDFEPGPEILEFLQVCSPTPSRSFAPPPPGCPELPWSCAPSVTLLGDGPDSRSLFGKLPDAPSRLWVLHQ